MDKQSLKDVICKFFIHEWPHVHAERLSVSKISEGYNSDILIVDRGGEAVDREPQKMIIRLPKQRGTYEDPLQMSLLEQVLTCNEFARTGCGARVYGVFTGGRVDEHVAGHCLTASESEDPLIRSEVAQCYARFHSQSLPCDKSRGKVFDETLICLFDEQRGNDKLIDIGESVGLDMSHFVDYDFANGMRFVLDRLDLMRGKKCWCVIDPQFPNVLVRDHPLEHERKVVLIDFEFTSYHYRGFDVGGHFFEKMFQKDDPQDEWSEGRLNKVEEQQHFCSEYLKEAASLQPNSIDPDIDSVDHLMQEAKLGMLLRLLFHLFCILRHIDRFGTEDASFFKTMIWMHNFFIKIMHELNE